MKNYKALILLALAPICLTGCKKKNQEEQKEEQKLDGVNLPTAPIEEYNAGASVILPSEGSEAQSPLAITASYTYFDNDDLHNLAGQWSGYGIHTPYILKHAGVYYMYQSTPKSNIGIKAFKSIDLLNWDYVTEAGFTSGYITKDRPTYASSSPRVYFYNDAFYLLFNSPNGYRVYSSTSPEGEFTFVKDLNYASKYNASVFIAPNGKLFFVTGGEKSVALYEMKSIFEIDESTRVEVDCTAIDSYSGQSFEVQSPSISLIDGVAYLTYSSVDESFKSYRSYLVSAISPDYSNAKAFADSFFNQRQGPILINTNDMHGDISLGDLSIIEGPDMVSYYAMYTSLESPGVRRVNFAPISYSGANISFAHRSVGQVKDVKTINEATLSGDSKKISTESTGNYFTANLLANKASEYYFSYRSANNNFVIALNNGEAVLSKKENGLTSEISKVSYNGNTHEVKVQGSNKNLTVYFDNKLLVNNYVSTSELSGKLGYTLSDGGKAIYTSFTNSVAALNERIMFKSSESNIYAASYLDEYSHFANAEPVRKVQENYSDFYGSYYLDLATFKDCARFLVDVKEAGRYGVEMTFNTAFSQHNSTIGLRVGDGDELMHQLNRIEGQGYARVLTAEFDVNKGANELFIENLSNNELKLIALRLVKVSASAPSYTNSLADFASKGIKYETDFELNEQYDSHEVYEGAKMFAYVGDNTITDFTMKIEVGFLFSQSISGFIGIGFRCDNFASSSKDGDDSLIGYYLEISQYQIKLMKYQYGYNLTLGIEDLVNTIGDATEYTIKMIGNQISVYKEDRLVFSICDQFAFSSGHLGFGSKDTNGVIRNLSVSKGE